MSWEKDSSFGSNWDLGSYICEDLAMYPIKSLVKNELVKAGVDPNSINRRGAVITTSIFTSLIGSALAGPLGFLLGAMGYLHAMGSRYPDDYQYQQEMAEKAITLKSAEIATRVLESHVSRNTWNRICDEVQYVVQKYSSSNPSIEKTIDLIYKAICRVNVNAGNQWHTVFENAYDHFYYEIGK
jgi:hypothetical protein